MDEMARREFVGLGAAIAAGGLCGLNIQQALAEPLERLD
jgi:hypothetical protein